MNSRSRKLLSYYNPYRRLLIADLACAFIVAAVSLALPLLVRYITKDVLEHGTAAALGRIYLTSAVMLAMIAIHTLCNMFVDYRGHAMGAVMESDMRAELFAHFQRLPFAFYDEQKTGQIMTRLTHDVFSMTELFHHGPEDIAISALKFLGAFVILWHINIELTVITFLFLPPMVVFAVYFNKRMNVSLRESRDRIGDINAQLEDTLAGIRVVKSFANEAVETKKFARENDRFVVSRNKAYKHEAYFYNGVVAFTQLITMAVVVFGGAAIVNATLDLADLLTFLLLVGILIDPIQRFGNFARLYQEGITGFDRFMDVLEERPEPSDAADAVDLAPGQTHVRGHLEFKNVSFKYHEDRAHVLKDISLTIKAGEYVVLVGYSGVGKTTLCSLIPRFYEATEGEILLDGRNIRDIHLRSLRRNVGIVQQDVYLFAGTVLDNIRYGRMDASRAEIIEAGVQANAHDFIMALPHGYDTHIGQRGVKLSGGQKQRLSIARVFLKDPPIIIFDEATSALDSESERAVGESLERLTHNRTTLVIAHRLSTVRNAQRIVVLTDNGIDEQGTHEALLERGGAYASQYSMQLAI